MKVPILQIGEKVIHAHEVPFLLHRYQLEFGLKAQAEKKVLRELEIKNRQQYWTED